MTSALGRVYTITLSIIVFFLAWAVIAARPWVEPVTPRTDPRIAALDARERRLRADAVKINALVKKRWTVYRVSLVKRKHQIAAVKQAQRAQAVRAAQAAQAAQATQSQVVSAAPSAPATHSAAPAPPPVVRVTPAPPATSTKTS
ncbi:MAG: hypothetical protein ACYDHO_02100 [Gaiellaceae bacterium]